MTVTITRRPGTVPMLARMAAPFALYTLPYPLARLCIRAGWDIALD